MTGIEWTDATWNPIVGCAVVSPGCTNCYAMKMAHRLGANPATPHYAGTTAMSRGGPVWTGRLALAPERVLTAPLRRGKPTTYFVNSMGDLFHEDVPEDWIDRVFAVMALAPQHRFQVLTKRASRMRRYFEAEPWDRINEHCAMLVHWDDMPQYDRCVLPHVWLGVSAEDQARAEERIPHLLATPAALRFVSAEPLLGPVDLTKISTTRFAGAPRINALSGRTADFLDVPAGGFFEHLDWVICGGESGPGARPMHPDWARSLRDQCGAAGVAFFFKQWGAWITAKAGVEPGRAPQQWLRDDGRVHSEPLSATMPGPRELGERRVIAGEEVEVLPKHNWMRCARVGKRAAGRLLDGRDWNGMPGEPS